MGKTGGIVRAAIDRLAVILTIDRFAVMLTIDPDQVGVILTMDTMTK